MISKLILELRWKDFRPQYDAKAYVIASEKYEATYGKYGQFKTARDARKYLLDTYQDLISEVQEVNLYNTRHTIYERVKIGNWNAD